MHQPDRGDLQINEKSHLVKSFMIRLPICPSHFKGENTYDKALRRDRESSCRGRAECHAVAQHIVHVASSEARGAIGLEWKEECDLSEGPLGLTHVRVPRQWRLEVRSAWRHSDSRSSLLPARSIRLTRSHTGYGLCTQTCQT